MKRITQFILCLVLAVSAYGQGVGGNSVPRTVSGISNALDLISSTQGTVFYRGASGWEALTPGTSGQLLSTQGAAANPIWVTATGGAGDMNGPASATDNAIVRFDGTGGKTVQNSAVTIADTTGAMTWSNAGGYLDLGASALTATAVNTGGLRSANFGLSTVSGGASYFGGSGNFAGTTSASSSTVGALTIGDGTAATNVAIGGGNINAGGAITSGSASALGNVTVGDGAGYSLSLTAAGARSFTFLGLSSGNDYTTTFANAGAGKHNLAASGTLSVTGAATFASSVSVSGTTSTWTSGTGSPESVKAAPVGSLYTRTDGGASTTLYIKESGSGNTGWVAK